MELLISKGLFVFYCNNNLDNALQFIFRPIKNTLLYHCLKDDFPDAYQFLLKYKNNWIIMEEILFKMKSIEMRNSAIDMISAHPKNKCKDFNGFYGLLIKMNKYIEEMIEKLSNMKDDIIMPQKSSKSDFKEILIKLFVDNLNNEFNNAPKDVKFDICMNQCLIMSLLHKSTLYPDEFIYSSRFIIHCLDRFKSIVENPTLDNYKHHIDIFKKFKRHYSYILCNLDSRYAERGYLILYINYKFYEKEHDEATIIAFKVIMSDLCAIEGRN